MLLDLAPVFALVAFVGAAWAFVSRLRRSREMVEQWAGCAGLRLVDAKYCWFSFGPFTWTKGSKIVYRIAVRTSDDVEYTGWAACGGWLLGLLTKRVEVIWDDSSPLTGGFPIIPLGRPNDRRQD